MLSITRMTRNTVDVNIMPNHNVANFICKNVMHIYGLNVPLYDK